MTNNNKKHKNVIMTADQLFIIKQAVSILIQNNERLHWDICSLISLDAKDIKSQNKLIIKLNKEICSIEKASESLTRLFESQFSEKFAIDFLSYSDTIA